MAGLWHLCHPQPSLGSTWLGASSCPTVLLAYIPRYLLSCLQLSPGAQTRRVLNVNFAAFLMFSSLYPTLHLSCFPTHSLAPVPIQFHGAPHHCPARQHVLIPLNILAQGRKKQMGKQPAGFAFLWGRQRETAVT